MCIQYVYIVYNVHIDMCDDLKIHPKYSENL